MTSYLASYNMYYITSGLAISFLGVIALNVITWRILNGGVAGMILPKASLMILSYFPTAVPITGHALRYLFRRNTTSYYPRSAL